MISLRKLKIITLIILLIGALIIYNPKEIMYQAGSYEGIGEGHHGPIKVQITTDEYEIKEIKIIEEQEIPVLARNFDIISIFFDSSFS